MELKILFIVMVPYVDTYGRTTRNIKEIVSSLHLSWKNKCSRLVLMVYENEEICLPPLLLDVSLLSTRKKT